MTSAIVNVQNFKDSLKLNYFGGDFEIEKRTQLIIDLRVTVPFQIEVLNGKEHHNMVGSRIRVV